MVTAPGDLIAAGANLYVNSVESVLDRVVSAEKYAAQHFLSGLNALSNNTLTENYGWVQNVLNDKHETDTQIGSTLNSALNTAYNVTSTVSNLDTNKMLSGLNAGWEGTKKGIDSGFNKLGDWAVEYKANAGNAYSSANFVDLSKNAKDVIDIASIVVPVAVLAKGKMAAKAADVAADMAALDKAERIKKVADELDDFPKSTLKAGLNAFTHNLPDILKKVDLTMKELLITKNTLPNDLDLLQISQLKAIRTAILMPTEHTLLQKVIPEADIAKYLSGDYVKPSGYIARADDISHARKIHDIIELLRLDYPNTLFTNESGYGIIRFKTDPDTIEIPFGTKLGGKNTDGLPCTLNGFTACRNGHVIPEFKIDRNIADLPQDGAELWHVDKNGVEKLLATFGKNPLTEKYEFIATPKGN